MKPVTTKEPASVKEQPYPSGANGRHSKMDFNKTKKLLFQRLLTSFETDLAALLKSAHEARDAATHEENVAEDKYDTRGLEQSYLAGGQARRAHELEELVYYYKHLTIGDASSHRTVTSPALVLLELNESEAWYFLIPKGFSQPIEENGILFTVITSQSPLGQELLGREKGDDFILTVAAKKKHYSIIDFH